MTDLLAGPSAVSARVTFGRSTKTIPSVTAVPLWLAWSIIGLAIIGGYLVLDGVPFQATIYKGVAFLAAGAVVLGIARNRPRHRGAWWMLACGIALMAIGEVLSDILATSGDMVAPSAADLANVSGTVAITLAAAALMLRRRPQITGLIDALIIGVATSILLWTLVVDPAIDGGALTPLESFTLAAYPILDIAMVSVLTVALLSGTPLERPTALFALAALAFLASDIAYTIVVATGAYSPGLIDVGWLSGYVLWGVAALSIRSGADRAMFYPGAATVWARVRPIVLTAAVTTPLIGALIERGHGRYDALAATVAAIVVSVAVIIRLESSIREKSRLLDGVRRLESTLQRQANEDYLTELPNRRGLAEMLAMAFAEGGGVALLVLDLDDFKSINDSLGHQAGDDLLRAVAQRLRSSVRTGDTVARFGGDEFAVVMSPCANMQAATDVAERILESLGDSITTVRGRVTISVSIGVALGDDAGASAETLLRDADLALYRAKAAGKRRWAMLDAEANAAAVRTTMIAGDLSRALNTHGLELEFQPIISLADGRIESFEALLRWDHPDLGMLLAGEFLPAAERSLHMPAIGRWVIERACATAAGWQRPDAIGIGVNVNVAAAQLADEAFPDIVLGALERSGLPGRLLTIELLESSLDAAASLGERLGRLREAGVRLAIDDFGIGYSSLARVVEIEVTDLKLDRSLVAETEDSRMIGAIVRLGQALGLRLIAEGVEADHELERLRSLGCDAVQGYLVSKPLPTSEVNRLIRSWTPSSEVAKSMSGIASAVDTGRSLAMNRASDAAAGDTCAVAASPSN